MSAKKMAMSVALAGILGASTAVAETSGAFFGAGFGFHGMSRETNLNLNNNLIITNFNISVKENDSAKAGSISLVAGYKNMSSENSGSRFYINYDYNQVFRIEKGNGEENELIGYQVVGLNADWLYDFTPNFGFFVGANLGLINWDTELYSQTPEFASSEWKIYFAGQLGLRGIFGENKNHAVEFIYKVPFTQTTIEYQNAKGEKVGETKLKQDYNAGIRYIYSF